MFCSTIIASINRPTLPAAVNSVLEQKFDADDFEVIVVNDTGIPLKGFDWQNSPRVHVLTTQRRERSVARNAGASIAKGKYLHFLDDDDILLPGALEAFWQLDQKSEAAWMYGCYQSMDHTNRIMGEYYPTVEGDFFAESVAGELISLGASLLSTERYFEVGGFDPTFIIVEDFDLARRFTFSTKISRTPELVARFRKGSEGSTSDWTSFAHQEIISRENTLNQPRVYSRLESSLRGKSYWRGRVGRIYLASIVRNIQLRRFLVAFDRLLAYMLLTRHYILSSDYWRGLRRIIQISPQEYVPFTGSE